MRPDFLLISHRVKASRTIVYTMMTEDEDFALAVALSLQEEENEAVQQSGVAAKTTFFSLSLCLSLHKFAQSLFQFHAYAFGKQTCLLMCGFDADKRPFPVETNRVCCGVPSTPTALPSTTPRHNMAWSALRALNTANTLDD